MVEIRIDAAPFQRAVQDFAAATRRDVQADMKRHARTFMRYVASVTPPAQGTGRDGAEAYRAGRLKIARQMSALMVPVKIKGRRIITQAFGRPIRPVTVPTVEKHPDVAGLYRANSRMLTNRIGFRINPGQKFYVDRQKFLSLLRDKQGHVGRLLSGWLAGMTVLGMKAQNWVSRHGLSRGRASLTEGDHWRFEVANVAVPGPALADLDRKVTYAMRYTANNINRQTAAIMAKNAARFNRQ